MNLTEEKPLKVIIGASSQNYEGWIQTQQTDLNMLRKEDWEKQFPRRNLQVILAEMVWEHLTVEEGIAAAQNCYEFLQPGGYVRCSVPDGFFRDDDYQKLVQVGGSGPEDHPAASHKVVYNYKTFAAVFQVVGYEVTLLEYCDEEGKFHYREWNPADGFIYRSKRFDHRNQGDQLGFVSLILDARKL